MKVLSVVPSFGIVGGVASHYEGLRPHWTVDMKYVTYGKRPKLPALLTLLPDYLHFVYCLLFSHIDLVVVNPSLRPYQLLRDGIYTLSAKLFCKKVVTFIHGWDDAYMKKIIASPSRFLSLYGKSDRFIVLYSGFKRQLVEAGISPDKICLSTTKVEDELLKDFDISKRDGKINQLLFLARADRSKGLDIVIRAFEILQNDYPSLRLSVCGTGDALDDTCEYVKEHKIRNVEFAGFVKGKQKGEHLLKSQVLILPTTHGEGMPTSVLEAMAMGLVVITRPIGGVNDFFIDGEHGYMTESLAPEVYASILRKLLQSSSLTRRISVSNYEYAKSHFMASSVASQLETIFKEI